MDSNVHEISNSSNHLPEPFDYFEGTWLPQRFQYEIKSIQNIEIRDDDTWVCSFPKTGTTWTQEMVWCIANDSDFKRAEEDLNRRFPWLEGSVIIHPKNSPIPRFKVQNVEQLSSPRFIKTHLPFHLLPKQLIEGKTKAKIIYVCRNPKDTCISTYHYAKFARGLNGTFEYFCDRFLNDKTTFGPYWKHVIGFWERKNSNNILFLQYEDMKKDLRQAIKQTATFLNKFLTDDQVCLLEDHLSFDKMKSNPSVNYEKYFDRSEANQTCAVTRVSSKFMRKGEADQWKTEMSADLIKKFDDWTIKNLDKYPEMKHQFSMK